MTQKAWAYIWTIFGLAAGLAVQAAVGFHMPHTGWPVVEILFALAIGAQLFKVEAPNHVLFHSAPIFYFAGALLLNPLLLFLLIAAPHVVEWAKERWNGTKHLNLWYLQPFNIAMMWISTRGAQEIYLVFQGHFGDGSPGRLGVALAAAGVFVTLNHALLGGALVLARDVSWRDSGVLDPGPLTNDLVLAVLGSVVAVLWIDDPWFIIPALAPLGLMYQALMVPQLKRDAEMDAKTNLYNARRFGELFAAELDRARRFDRPLALVMADMDFLREINNTHGHLAGDAVISGIGSIIRNSVRDYDIAGRFGGEEFALVLPEVEEEQARDLAERLRQAIEAARFSHAKGSEPLSATMSLGVACFPNHGATTTELMRVADAAVYAAKSGGRNRVVCAGDLPTDQLVAALKADLPPVEQDPSQAAPAVPAVPDLDTPTAPAPVTLQAVEADSGPTRLGRAMVFAVLFAGLAVSALGFSYGSPASAPVVAVLAMLAAVAELLEVDLFGQGTVSVSVGIAFTAAVLTGFQGLTWVSLVIAAVHHLNQRRGLNQAHRAGFNWAVHILAGAPVVLALNFQHLAVRAYNLPLLVPTAVVAASAYFTVETGLIAAAVALDKGDGIVATWRTHFRWLLVHYVVLCLMGLALSLTFVELGTLGVVIFALPLLMMHYVQRQYVTQARENLLALQRLNRDLVHAALHDHLTELGNERGFQEALRREVEAAAQHRGAVVLARINVDEFKAINEELGRRGGDAVLVEVAALLRHRLSGAQAFRLTGDEFGVLFANTVAAEALASLDRMRREVPARLNTVTVSVGVATLHDTTMDADQLVEQTAEAMREAKRRGRNAIVAFDEIRESTLVASAAQAQSVRKLLTEGHLSVAFQPIWDIDRGTVLGYEALARPAPSYHLSGPQEAFDVAARLGRAHDLDALCRRAILARMGELPPNTYLFMNLAPESLEHDRISILEMVEAAGAAGLPAEQIVFEITERSVIRPEALARQAQRLREVGFKLALDDTGAGNAGLGVLSQLQVDFVKIDRAVVSNAGADRAARAVLAGIFALAREMGAVVIAEGIETAAMLELVCEMSQPPGHGSLVPGRAVQGYLLGHPSESFLGPVGTQPLDVPTPVPDPDEVRGWEILRTHVSPLGLDSLAAS